jgi:endonuclease I
VGSCLDQKGEGVLAPVLPVEGVTETSHLPFFEPPAGHKGNVARALFYFATRYRVKMSETQEFYLRKWNKMDPPDDMEIKRNQRIYELSGVRNPYIDHPEYVDLIPSFSK